MLNKKCFSINSYLQFEQLIEYKHNKKEILIIFIKNYLIKGFGIDWLRILINSINKKYHKYNIKFFVDCGNDYGLSIQIMEQNIDYLKIRTNKIILNKINQIAKKNKVSINPNFNVVDLSKIKNFKNLKI